MKKVSFIDVNGASLCHSFEGSMIIITRLSNDRIDFRVSVSTFRRLDSLSNNKHLVQYRNGNTCER